MKKKNLFYLIFFFGKNKIPSKTYGKINFAAFLHGPGHKAKIKRKSFHLMKFCFNFLFLFWFSFPSRSKGRRRSLKRVISYLVELVKKWLWDAPSVRLRKASSSAAKLLSMSGFLLIPHLASSFISFAIFTSIRTERNGEWLRFVPILISIRAVFTIEFDYFMRFIQFQIEYWILCD